MVHHLKLIGEVFELIALEALGTGKQRRVLLIIFIHQKLATGQALCDNMTGVLGVWSRTTSSKLPAHDIIGLDEVLTRHIGF